MVETIDDQQTLIQALIENLQREDMSPLDTARGLKALKDATGWSNMEIERRGIMTNGNVTKLLGLLKLPEKVQTMLDPLRTEEGITPYHIEQITSVKHSPELMTAVLQKAAAENLSAVQTRRLAESVAAAPSEPARERLLEWDYSPYLHDPENIKDRAKKLGAYDPMYVDLHPKTASQAWQETPAVSNVISLMKGWMASLTDFRKADEVGKMSPEAKDFIARRARDFANALTEWADKLESNNE